MFSNVVKAVFENYGKPSTSVFKLLVHPFRVVDHTWTFYSKSDVRNPMAFFNKSNNTSLSPQQIELAEWIFDTLPGVQGVYFLNGEIEVHHNETFSSEVLSKHLVGAVVDIVFDQEHKLEAQGTCMVCGADICDLCGECSKYGVGDACDNPRHRIPYWTPN